MHVKRKENQMNRYDLDDFYSNPALFHRLAQRERNRAIRAGFAWLRQQLVSRFNFRPNQWVERLG